MKITSIEKIIENMKVSVYPVTVMKFLLNKRTILSYFELALSSNFEKRGVQYSLDNSNCVACQQKQKIEKNMLCRQHTSIKRVLEADNVLFDLDTNVYLYKNEIFRVVGNKLIIVYCPHTKLIIRPITNAKVRKVSPITIEDPIVLQKLQEKKIKNSSGFLSTKFLDQYMKCWFNEEFSIVSVPNDRDGVNWCLVSNN